MPPARHQPQSVGGAASAGGHSNAHRSHPYPKKHGSSSSRPGNGTDGVEPTEVKRERDRETEGEKKRKRKRDRERARVPTAAPDVKPPSSEMDLDHPTVKTRPLSLAAPGGGGDTNIPIPNPSSSASLVQQKQKLEQKVEKQRARLKDAEARLLQAEERGKQDAERIRALEAMMKEQEGAMRTREEEKEGEKQRADQNAKTIQDHLADREQLIEAVQESVSCLICSDTLSDPHILSCGHMACRDCLKAWFRQPNAYLHDVHGTITPTRDMSYRAKVCHVCRTTVVRRPTRTYNLYTFLEPLGIAPIIPTPQLPAVAIANNPPAPAGAQEQGTAADPWDKLFPVESATYRLRDEEDGGTDRCPSCLHEIYDNMCDSCGAEFSEHESDDDMGSATYDNDNNDPSDDEDDDDNAEHPPAVRVGRAVGGRRRAHVDIATIEEVLGDTDDDHAQMLPLGVARPPTPPLGRRNQRRPIPDPYDPDHDDDFEVDDTERELRDRERQLAERRGLGRQFGSPPPGLFDSDSDSDHVFTDEDGDEYDGSVPRRLPRGSVSGTGSDEDDESDDEYGGSFINDSLDGHQNDDDDDDDGYDLESTGTLGDGEGEDGHDLIGLDHEGHADEEEEEGTERDDASDDLIVEHQDQEEDEEEEDARPNMAQLRRRRLAALVDSRRARSGPVGGVVRPIPDTDSDHDPHTHSE